MTECLIKRNILNIKLLNYYSCILEQIFYNKNNHIKNQSIFCFLF